MTQTAVITGASSGIGKACALALLKEGWQVALIGRRADALQAAIAEAGAQGANALAVPTDVSREADVARAFDTIVGRFGRVDLLFNNAGVSMPYCLPGDYDPAKWREAVDINLNGAFFCLSNAFRIMQQQDPKGGRIINNGSISAYAPRPGSIAYTATKHAITGLTRAANLDGRAHNIAVGQIDIGNVASDMTLKMTQGVPQADGSVKAEARMEMASVVETFLTMAKLPLSSNILFTTVMATQMPFVGRG
ncbi:MAG: SDR family oxidoreductase [Limnohabitans sp.]|jgi:NAD(P)-dependent dehydrogenase (short-subunit alcohol dehydrogenase family)|nr:SDR family oxidoreductase [Limnohabitans sp.]